MLIKQDIIVVDELPNSYIQDVENDIKELKEYYKYVTRVYIPLVKPHLAYLKIIAVNNELVEKIHGNKEDYNKDYSKEIIVIVPLDYKTKGCYVYGAKWVDIEKIPQKQRHFFLNDITADGYKRICVGVPSSHKEMKNPILENVRTAEHILFEYELYLSGYKNKIELIEYSHGIIGEEEYENNVKKYKTI